MLHFDGTAGIIVAIGVAIAAVIYALATLTWAYLSGRAKVLIAERFGGLNGREWPTPKKAGGGGETNAATRLGGIDPQMPPEAP